MKKIIIRNPFISNERRELAKMYLEVAHACFHLASLMQAKNDGKMDGRAYEYCCKGADYLNKGARCLGFRNAGDMSKFVEVYKRLP